MDIYRELPVAERQGGGHIEHGSGVAHRTAWLQGCDRNACYSGNVSGNAPVHCEIRSARNG